MKLSLSVRVAEQLMQKRIPAMSLEDLAEVALSAGYRALCMRASQLGIQTPLDEVREKGRWLESKGLAVSMVTGDFPIPENTDDAPDALRKITPYLDLMEALGSDLMRIGMKTYDDIVWAQRACDEAKERGMRLAHQSHTESLFEQVEESLAVVAKVARENFGIIYEPANLVQCGEPYGASTIRAFAPHTFNVYFQNLRESPDGESVAQPLVQGRGEVRPGDDVGRGGCRLPGHNGGAEGGWLRGLRDPAPVGHTADPAGGVRHQDRRLPARPGRLRVGPPDVLAERPAVKRNDEGQPATQRTPRSSLPHRHVSLCRWSA